MSRKLNVLSLFTGAGGLDLGLEAAGFRTRLCVEQDEMARSTLMCNRPDWTLALTSDVVEFSRDPFPSLKKARLTPRSFSVLAGGPPCQPFSKAAFWTPHGPKRMRDPRAYRTIHAYVGVVDTLLPKVLLFENVSAFTYKGRDEGYRALLKGIRRINRKRGVNYKPQMIHLNAADYGVPQVRERVFIVAHIEGKQLKMPLPTHGPRSPHAIPYLTAWDALGESKVNTRELMPSGRWAGLLPSIPEGHNYLWHTPGGGGTALFGKRTRYWSFLLKLGRDRPSWTISASPGPAAGPFHWSNRLLSTSELSKLQTFPKNYRVIGTRRAAQKQIGNAVPSALAELVGLEIRKQLLGMPIERKRLRLLPPRRATFGRKKIVRPIPKSYLRLIGNHKPHPGIGLGPARG